MAPLIGQRVFGIALGHEDLIDHDRLRHGPVLAVLAGKPEVRRTGRAPLAGKSTLSQLESAPSGELGRYHRIGYEGVAAKVLLVDLDGGGEPSPSCTISTLVGASRQNEQRTCSTTSPSRISAPTAMAMRRIGAEEGRPHAAHVTRMLQFRQSRSLTVSI